MRVATNVDAERPPFNVFRYDYFAADLRNALYVISGASFALLWLLVALAPIRSAVQPAASTALPAGISSIMQKPRYAHASWNLLVTDLATGKSVVELHPDRLAFTGSVRKLFLGRPRAELAGCSASL